MNRIRIGLLISICLCAHAYEEDSPLYYGTTSDNFVIRWGYQSLADHVYDVRNLWKTAPGPVQFEASDVKPGDILFVRNLDYFFKRILPDIQNPFILVSAGECMQRVTKTHYSYLSNDKVLAWFPVHCAYTPHEKMTILPLGIYQERKHFDQKETYAQWLSDLRRTPKDKLLYMNFSGKKDRADRPHVYELFKDKDYCYNAGRKSFKKYMEEMAEYRFTLSPRGIAIDCYRNWEALLVGTIPIVKSSKMDPVFDGLPVLIVDNWEDITQDYLEKKYEEMTRKKYTIEKLFLEYWQDKIYSVRDDYLKARNTDDKKSTDKRADDAGGSGD